jgi:dihydroorotase
MTTTTIEKPAGIANPKDFRHEIVNFVLRARANNNGNNPAWTSYEKLRSVIEKKMFSTTEDLLPVISFNAKASVDEHRKHQNFMEDELAKFEWQMVNDRGGLLQQKEAAGLPIEPAELEQGHAEGVFTACKLYPANATTNSAAGVSDLAKLTAVFETLERIGLPLLIHGEVTDSEIDIFDREAVFIERHLEPLLRRHPGLKVVLEHITTAEAADFVRTAGPTLAATITPHHLHINRNAMFRGGLRPDFYCLPVAKRERHRLALVAAATSGDPKFFLGTDSAPHPRQSKEAACGCAGIYNAPYAIESYAMVFEAEGQLERLEAFASEHGPRFYGLPLNADSITLVREAHTVPPRIHANDAAGVATSLVPFHAGAVLSWQLVDPSTP